MPGDDDAIQAGEHVLEFLVIEVLTDGNDFGSTLFQPLDIRLIDLLLLGVFDFV